MSIVKSLSVGDGDMFYIKHENDTLTIIDCCMSEEDRGRIVEELKRESKGKRIKRFISTHPDNDHIKGLKYLFDNMNIPNFYCVKNEANKRDTGDDFETYCELREAQKTYLKKGCRRRWLNKDDDERRGRRGSGIQVLWPDTNNKYYKDALENASNCEVPNNISCILNYKLKNCVRVLWMGDLLEEFMKNVECELAKLLCKADILFAPHHSRDSGTIPRDLHKIIDPKIIVVGEASSKHLNYYDGYHTITQNSAGDITFECISGKVHIYVSKTDYNVDFLYDENIQNTLYGKYIGTLMAERRTS